MSDVFALSPWFTDGFRLNLSFSKSLTKYMCKYLFMKLITVCSNTQSTNKINVQCT